MKTNWIPLLIATLLCSCILSHAQEKYALIIGIKGYPAYPRNERLRYCDKDAVSFSEMLKTKWSGGNIKPENIRLLTNDSATRDKIIQGYQWLGRKAKSNDIVYIYYSGHGEMSPAGHSYLMPWDGSPNAFDISALRTDRLFEDIRANISCRALLLFFDACHSGAAISYSALKSKRKSVTVSMNEALNNIFQDYNQITMGIFSSQADQSSIEDTVNHHGLFTHYLIQGLNGVANRNGDKVVQAGELFDHLSDSVQHRSKGYYKLLQSPVKSPYFDNEFPLTAIDQTPLDYSTSVKKWETLMESRRKYNTGDTEGAKQIYLKVLNSDSSQINALNGLAGFLVDQMKIELAFTFLDRAIKSDSNNITTTLIKARGYINQKQLEPAKAIYLLLLTMNPNHIEALIGLSEVYLLQSDLPNAATQIRKLTQISSNPRYVYQYGELAARMGFLRVAREYLLKFQRRSGNNDSLKVSMLKVADYNKNMKSSINFKELLLERAEKFLDEKKYHQALLNYQEAYLLEESPYLSNMINHVLHDYLFEYNTAYNMLINLRNTATLLPGDRLNFVEVAIANGKLDEAKKEIDTILNMGRLPESIRIIALYLDFVHSVYNQESDVIKNYKLETVIKAYRLISPNENLQWVFNGIKHYIERYGKVPNADRKAMLVLTELLQERKRDWLIFLKKELPPTYQWVVL